MEGFQQIWIALACLQLWSIAINSSQVHQYPPVLEGTNLTFTCSGTTQSADRSVHWNGNLPNSTLENFVACDSETCTKRDNQIVETTASFEGNNFNSTLTVQTINHWNSYRYLQCLVYDTIFDKSRVVEEWHINKILYAAYEPNCSAVVSNVVEISITCSTSKIFPHIICQFFEVSENATSIMENTLTRYTVNSIDSRGYKSASCSIVKTVTLPGEYTYRATIYPDINTEDITAAAKEATTQRVIIPGTPSAVIQQTCEEKSQPMGFFCTAYWLPRRPEFVWLLNGKVLNGTISNCTSERCLSSYISFVDLASLKSIDENVLKCEAHYKDDASQIDTLVDYDVSLKDISSQPPYFTVTKPANKKRETTFTLRCEVTKNNIELLSLEVKCFTNDKGDLMVNEAGKKMSVSFDLNFTNSSNIIYCQCVAYYATRCHNESVDLTLTFEDVSLPSPHWLEITAATTAIIFSVTGFVVLIFLIISSVAYIKSRARSNCSNVYSSVHTLKTSDTTTSQQESHVHQESFDDLPVEMAPASPKMMTYFSGYSRNENDGEDIIREHFEMSVSNSPPLPPRNTRPASTKVPSTLALPREAHYDISCKNKNPHTTLPKPCKKRQYQVPRAVLTESLPQTNLSRKEYWEIDDRSSPYHNFGSPRNNASSVSSYPRHLPEIPPREPILEKRRHHDL